MAEKRFPIWANTFIPDIGNGDPNIIDPGEPKQESGFIVEKPLVQETNWILRQLGRFVTDNNTTREEADGYVSSAGECIVLDNFTAEATGFLPAEPIDGQWVLFSAKVSYYVHNAFVDGNGNDIMLLGDALVRLNIRNRAFKFTWSEAENMWKISIDMVLGEVR